MLLYTTLAPWYTLLTPLADYEEEASTYQGFLDELLGEPPSDVRRTLLELGAGAGHNAHYLSRSFDLTLVDREPGMLKHAAVSCPGARLVEGDMRSVRLNATFDAVFVHDAICYLVRREDVVLLLATAAAHLRPGGALVLCPDCVEETFVPGEEEEENTDGDRRLSYREHSYRVPGEPGYIVDYTVTTQEGEAPPIVTRDRHHEGLFSRAEWRDMLAEAGFVLLRNAVWHHPDVDYPLDAWLAHRASPAGPDGSTGAAG